MEQKYPTREALIGKNGNLTTSGVSCNECAGTMIGHALAMHDELDRRQAEIDSLTDMNTRMFEWINDALFVVSWSSESKMMIDGNAIMRDCLAARKTEGE